MDAFKVLLFDIAPQNRIAEQVRGLLQGTAELSYQIQEQVPNSSDLPEASHELSATLAALRPDLSFLLFESGQLEQLTPLFQLFGIPGPAIAIINTYDPREVVRALDYGATGAGEHHFNSMPAAGRDAQAGAYMNQNTTERTMNIADDFPAETIQLLVPDPDALYPIEEAAEIVHVPRRTILLYHKNGLLPPAVDSEGGGYYFDLRAIRRLRLIYHLDSVCGVNTTGIRIIVDLMNRVERLEEGGCFRPGPGGPLPQTSCSGLLPDL